MGTRAAIAARHAPFQTVEDHEGGSPHLQLRTGEAHVLEERPDHPEPLLIDPADPSRDGWLLGGPGPERHVVAGGVMLQQVLHQQQQALPGISLGVRHVLGHA